MPYCVCGTDLHATVDFHTSGVTLGHEFSGHIVSVGSSVRGWAEGDRVTINPDGDWCGACAQCRAGATSMCPRIWETAVGTSSLISGVYKLSDAPARIAELRRSPTAVKVLSAPQTED